MPASTSTYGWKTTRTVSTLGSFPEDSVSNASSRTETTYNASHEKQHQEFLEKNSKPLLERIRLAQEGKEG
jgi:hypothetical protein